MYLTPTDNHWACDIEGDDLYAGVTKVHCLSVENIVSKEELLLVGDEILPWIKEHPDAVYIFHNGIFYDTPVLNKILRAGIPLSRTIDTMVMSMMYNPSIAGGHSLAAWGERLKYAKGDFKGPWDVYTEEMGEYCQRDAKLCGMIYRELVRRMRKEGFSEFGIEIEHRGWEITRKQKINGFAFDIEKAHTLYAYLKKKEKELEDKIYAYWPPSLKCVAQFKRPFKKDGSMSENLKRHLEQYEKIEVSFDESTYDAYDYVYFNIGSADQRREKLLQLGWKPRKSEVTKGGLAQPIKKGKLAQSLVEFVETTGNEQIKLIANWLEVSTRSTMINTWIEAYNENTGCIHGSIWMASTLRYRHSAPNTANIPAVRLDSTERPLRGEDGVWTYEARDLWTTRDPSNRVLVGVDAKGIQLRVLANYLNNKKFTEALLDGDPHSYNQEIGGFETRAKAKTFIYAFLLGAGDELVGQIIGGTTKDGRETKARFIGNFPGLSDLLNDLERQVERTGRIVLCDGTPVLVKDMHARLGYLLQGDESRIMRYAGILAHQEVRRRKLDILKVGDIHDEWQNDALRAHADEFGYDVCPISFRASGQRFSYNIPIDCDAKIGLTWAETH